MTYPDLPDGYYLAEQEGQRPGIIQRSRRHGEPYWRGQFDVPGNDPRIMGYVLTPVSAITAMKADLAAMTARAEKAEAAQAWQPIDTSPRTNRARLVYCPDRKNKYLVTWLETVDTFDSAEGHWLHFNSGRPLREEPSLWMPLPPNPTEDAQ